MDEVLVREQKPMLSGQIAEILLQAPRKPFFPLPIAVKTPQSAGRGLSWGRAVKEICAAAKSCSHRSRNFIKINLRCIFVTPTSVALDLLLDTGQWQQDWVCPHTLTHPYTACTIQLPLCLTPSPRGGNSCSAQQWGKNWRLGRMEFNFVGNFEQIRRKCPASCAALTLCSERRLWPRPTANQPTSIRPELCHCISCLARGREDGARRAFMLHGHGWIKPNFLQME